MPTLTRDIELGVGAEGTGKFSLKTKNRKMHNYSIMSERLDMIQNELCKEAEDLFLDDPERKIKIKKRRQIKYIFGMLEINAEEFKENKTPVSQKKFEDMLKTANYLILESTFGNELAEIQEKAGVQPELEV